MKVKTRLGQWSQTLSCPSFSNDKSSQLVFSLIDFIMKLLQISCISASFEQIERTWQFSLNLKGEYALSDESVFFSQWHFCKCDNLLHITFPPWPTQLTTPNYRLNAFCNLTFKKNKVVFRSFSKRRFFVSQQSNSNPHMNWLGVSTRVDYK